VENCAHSVHCSLNDFSVPNISQNKLEIAVHVPATIPESHEISLFPGAQVIKHTDRFAFFQQAFNEVASNKSCTSRHEYEPSAPVHCHIKFFPSEYVSALMYAADTGIL
jgi:hypothetical protein